MQIDAQHPALAGHFPGRPVVPGVVLLDHVAAALARHLGRPARIIALPNVKFLAPLMPHQDFEIGFVEKRPDSFGFELRSGGQLLAQGNVKVAMEGSA